MKLYSSWSLNPQKVLFAAQELRLHPDVVELDLFAGEQRSETFAALNPMQKVPVLDDGGFVLWESNAILAYWGEQHRRLWPDTPERKADALRWMFFEARHLAESVGALWFFDTVAPKVGVPIDAEAVERGRKELVRPLDVLEQHLAAQPWMLGPSFTLVDCCIGADLVGVAASSFDWSRYPTTRSYVERVRGRDAWRATAPRY